MSETGVLLIDQKDQLGIIVANTIVGLVALSTMVWIVPMMFEQGLPQGRSDALLFGFLAGMVCLPIVFLGLAYSGLEAR